MHIPHNAWNVPALIACSLLLVSCTWFGAEEENLPDTVVPATSLEEDGEIDNPITGGGILLDDDGLTTEGVVLAQETDDPIDPDLPASDPLTQEGAVIYFSYDSAHIDERAVPRILEVGEALLADPALRARLEGHTDERGTRSYNLSLGELRGQSVRAFLKQQGVEGNRIEVVSHGEEIPVVEGSDEEAWKQNRRVEILLSQ